ncbi:MAG: transporter [Planctomycetales bacterium]
MAARSLKSLLIWFVSLSLLVGGVSAQEFFPIDESAGRFQIGQPEPTSIFRQERGSASGQRTQTEEERELETDRDSFTPATTLVSPGRFILESAYSFIDNRATFDTHSLPELVLRYGLTERLEVRLQWNYEVGGAGNTVSAEGGDEDFDVPGIERESQVGYGLKLRCTQQRGWIPESAFLALGFSPTSGPDNVTSFVGTYVFGWTLPGRWKLDGAFRYSCDSVAGDGHNLWAPSVVLKIPMGERINLHAEYFGIFTTQKSDNSNGQYFSPGLHYLLSRDLEVGFRVGWGLNDDAARFFVNTGVGWRF